MKFLEQYMLLNFRSSAEQLLTVLTTNHCRGGKTNQQQNQNPPSKNLIGGNTVFLAYASKLQGAKTKLMKENKTYILCEKEKFLFSCKILFECFLKEVGPVWQMNKFCSCQDVQLGTHF